MEYNPEIINCNHQIKEINSEILKKDLDQIYLQSSSDKLSKDPHYDHQTFISNENLPESSPDMSKIEELPPEPVINFNDQEPDSSKTYKLEAQNKKKYNDSKCIDSPIYLPRYCIACSLDQPARARHCFVCKRCVHKYDHHCTWLGSCIGEKNYVSYYIYLVFQTLELVLGISVIIRGLEESISIVSCAIVLVLVVPACLFSIFLCSLHTYLIFKGLTTWEFIARKSHPR